MLTLQRLGSQVSDTYMAVLKWNMTIGYVKELD